MKKTKSKEFLYPIDGDWLMGDPDDALYCERELVLRRGYLLR